MAADMRLSCRKYKALQGCAPTGIGTRRAHVMAPSAAVRACCRMPPRTAPLPPTPRWIGASANVFVSHALQDAHVAHLAGDGRTLHGAW